MEMRAGEAPRQLLPPGFRFHPTDVEVLLQYLRRKALSRPLPAAVIPVVDAAALPDPWDLPGACRRARPDTFLHASMNVLGWKLIIFRCISVDCCRRERRGGGVLLQPAAGADERRRLTAEESGQWVLEGHGEGEAGARAAARPVRVRQRQAGARRRQDGAQVSPRKGAVIADRVGHARVPPRRRGRRPEAECQWLPGLRMGRVPGLSEEQSKEASISRGR
jgi:hypothetical protein